MTYRTLSLQCHCGRPSSSIKEVGFTSDHQLVLHWRCPECKSSVYGLKPLHDCWQVCPTEEESDGDHMMSEQDIEKLDAKFLQDLGVKFLDGEPAPPAGLDPPSEGICQRRPASRTCDG